MFTQLGAERSLADVCRWHIARLLEELGVLDHDVTLPTGVTVHNPVRVLPNATGSEVVFTLFQLPGVSDAKFGDDARLVAHDLQTLKTVIERNR